MATSDFTSNVYHDGELAVQERAGSSVQAANSGRMISDSIIPGAIKFVKKQVFMVAGSVDELGNVWASMVVGNTGFMTAESRTMQIDLSQSWRLESDPLWRNLSNDTRLGMLIIDLRSRARLRVNGRVNFEDDNQLHVDVEQAYPNCPQYIQRRNYRPEFIENTTKHRTTFVGTELNQQQQDWIVNADTFFVASQHVSGGIDASHRGGNPGFVQIESSKRLRIPDYPGNGMFNTLGNFYANPHAGIVFPDFENGRTLQLSGQVTLLWDAEDQRNPTKGTNRFWEFEIDRLIQIENSLPGTTEFLDYSPHNPKR